MKRPNPDLVRTWNIDLASTATKATTIADGIRTSAEQMHRAIDAMNWSGEARQAADSRCQREVTQMRVLAAAYDDLANALNNGHSQMGQPVSTLRADYTSLVSDRYIVHFDWTVVDETDDSARTQEAANQTIRLQRLADELGWADHNCAKAVNKAVDAINQLTPETAGLNPRLAREDIDAFRNGTATTEQLQRLRWATTLSPEQLDTLASGQQVMIPQQQLDYLTAVMRDLDGMSATQISQIGAGLPDGQDKVVQAGLADAIQLASNPQVTASGLTSAQGGKVGVDFGGLGALPSQLRTTLTEDPKNSVVKKDDLLTVSNILAKGSPLLAEGTDADRALLNQAVNIANRDSYPVLAGGADVTNFTDTMDDSIASKILSQAGGDRAAVHDLLTGHGMEAVMAPGEKFDNQAAIGTLLDHNWHGSDDGVTKVLKTVDDNATSSNPHVNSEAGQSARQIANYVSTHREVLLHLTDETGGPENLLQDPVSIGSANPQMTAQLGETLANYIPAMAGVRDSDLAAHGFYDNNGGDFDKKAMANVFAVIDSDPDAAKKFNANAYQAVADLNQMFGATGTTDYSLAEWGARIDQAAQDGALLEIGTREADGVTAQKEKMALFDSVREVGAYGLKRIPLAGDLLELGWKSTSPEVRLGALGTVPEAATHVDTSTYGSTPAQTYNILEGIANSPGHPDLRSDPNIGRYFDQETGQLRSFEDIRHEGGRPAGTNLPELNTNVGKYAPTVSEYRDRWDSGHGREPGDAPK